MINLTSAVTVDAPSAGLPPSPLHVLVLQGGGALGAYQAGTYQAMEEAGVLPRWIVGTSIGAINGALIAGNPPERRLTQLRAFWHLVAGSSPCLPPQLQAAASLWGMASSLVAGVPGFFALKAPWEIPFALNWNQAGVSFYDTAPLRRTLARLVDFEFLRHGPTRLSIGAVDVTSGELRYFDSAAQVLSAEHIMASGALPPGFPPVPIDRAEYWDGGVYSNTPLEYVVDDTTHQTKVCFAVDLWNATGAVPSTILAAAARLKEIQYASRTKRWIRTHKTIHDLRHAVRALAEQLPPAAKADPEFQRLIAQGTGRTINIVHLVAPADDQPQPTRDIDFSANTVERRWQAGYEDMLAALSHKAWLKPLPPNTGIVVHEFARNQDGSVGHNASDSSVG
ncbi:patatin-like phospholipase family protein [Cupriavidus sp. 8B]